MNVDYGVEIINFSDIPTKGTGLGSSSSFLVGLLLALHTLEGRDVNKESLADQACYIEIEKCRKANWNPRPARSSTWRIQSNEFWSE